MKRALCVGLNYHGTPNELAGCVNDARDWHEHLGSRGYDDVTLLLEEQATRRNVLDELERLRSNTKRGDDAVFTFSGHGSWRPDQDGDEPDGRDELLCPWDVSDGEVISDDELYDVFSRRATGSRLVCVSDSCHSGTVARMVRDTPQPGESRVRFLDPAAFMTGSRLKKAVRMVENALHPSPQPLSKAKVTKRLKSSALLMSGCRDWEYSYDAWFDGRASGAFTHAVMTILKGNHEDGQPTTWAQLAKAMPSLLPSTRFPQKPQLVGTSAQKKWRVP